MNLQKLAEFRSVIEAMEYPELEPFTGSLKLIYDDQVDMFQKEAGEFTDRLHDVLRRYFPQNAPENNVVDRVQQYTGEPQQQTPSQSPGLSPEVQEPDVKGPGTWDTEWNPGKTPMTDRIKQYLPGNESPAQPQAPQEAPAPEAEVPYGGQTPGGLHVPEQQPKPELAMPDKNFDPKRMQQDDAGESKYSPYRGLGEQVDIEDLQNKSQGVAQAVDGFKKFVNQMNQAPHGYDPAFVQGVNQVWKQLNGLIRKHLQNPRRDLQKQVGEMPYERQTYPPQQQEFLGKYAKNIRYL